MADEDLKAEVERLKAENERLKGQRGRSGSLKVSEKGGVSVYGLGRFPVTLYKGQWTQLLAMADEIRAFIKDHDAELKTKPEVLGRRAKYFGDGRARWDNDACGRSTGSSAPTFSSGFRSRPASIDCTMPPARSSMSAKRVISGDGWPSTERPAGSRRIASTARWCDRPTASNGRLARPSWRLRSPRSASSRSSGRPGTSPGLSLPVSLRRDPGRWPGHALLPDHLTRSVRRVRRARRVSLAPDHPRGLLRAHALAPLRRTPDRPASARSAERAPLFPRLHVPPTAP